MSVIVGAYAASPAHGHWDPELEQEFFRALAEVPGVRGLELPWTGSVHPHDDDWLYAHFPRDLDAVLTSIPGTMTRLRHEPRFGLASTDAEGRAAAVRQALAIGEAAKRLNDACGRAAVLAIELHSAPSIVAGATGSSDALRASLAALVETGDWDDAALVIEHCDAAVPGRIPEKGFLALEEELTAVDGLPDTIGVSINWGRSAIELRDPDRVAAQVEQAAQSGRLHAMVFSGASDRPSSFGPAWVDAHHPLAPLPDGAEFPGAEPASLLTLPRLRAAVAAAGPVRWAGVKFGWADAGAPVGPRIAMIEAAARLLTRELSSAA